MTPTAAKISEDQFDGADDGGKNALARLIGGRQHGVDGFAAFVAQQAADGIRRLALDAFAAQDESCDRDYDHDERTERKDRVISDGSSRLGALMGGPVRGVGLQGAPRCFSWLDGPSYSRLMGQDESDTLAGLKALRQEVVDPPSPVADGPPELRQAYMKLLLEGVTVSHHEVRLEGSPAILEKLAQNGAPMSCAEVLPLPGSGVPYGIRTRVAAVKG